MIATTLPRRTGSFALAALTCLAMHPLRTLAAQDSATTGTMRTIESLRRDELLRLRTLDSPASATPVLARFRRYGADTLWVVPELPRPKPLFHRKTPAPYAVPALATIDVGRRVIGGRESINRGAQQGLVTGVVLFAALGALMGATDDGDCGGDGCLFGPITPWEGVQGGVVTGVTIGPIVGAVVGGMRTSWRWQPVTVAR